MTYHDLPVPVGDDDGEPPRRLAVLWPPRASREHVGHVGLDLRLRHALPYARSTHCEVVQGQGEKVVPRYEEELVVSDDRKKVVFGIQKKIV